MSHAIAQQLGAAGCVPAGASDRVSPPRVSVFDRLSARTFCSFQLGNILLYVYLLRFFTLRFATSCSPECLARTASLLEKKKWRMEEGLEEREIHHNLTNKKFMQSFSRYFNASVIIGDC
jgi:hypothetical protein